MIAMTPEDLAKDIRSLADRLAQDVHDQAPRKPILSDIRAMRCSLATLEREVIEEAESGWGTLASSTT